MNTLIIGGRGRVGNALSNQLTSLGHTVSHFGSKDKRAAFGKVAARSDIVFVAMPALGNGEVAVGYMLDALRQGKPVITCEKGAYAHHYDQLKSYEPMIGRTATVGGGSGMLELFKFPRFELGRIYGVINGTLNFLFSECAKGKDPRSVISEAQRLGLCEPGNFSLAQIVNGEILDMVLKLVNLFNFSGISNEILRVSDFGSLRVSESEILDQLKRGTQRFIVSIGREAVGTRDDLYASLKVWKDGWFAEILLVDISSIPFNPVPELQQNALLIEDLSGITQITGIGAGPVPTAAAMIGDMFQLIGLNN